MLSVFVFAAKCMVKGAATLTSFALEEEWIMSAKVGPIHSVFFCFGSIFPKKSPTYVGLLIVAVRKMLQIFVFTKMLFDPYGHFLRNWSKETTSPVLGVSSGPISPVSPASPFASGAFVLDRKEEDSFLTGG